MIITNFDSEKTKFIPNIPLLHKIVHVYNNMIKYNTKFSIKIEKLFYHQIRTLRQTLNTTNIAAIAIYLDCHDKISGKQVKQNFPLKLRNWNFSNRNWTQQRRSTEQSRIISNNDTSKNRSNEFGRERRASSTVGPVFTTCNPSVARSLVHVVDPIHSVYTGS